MQKRIEAIQNIMNIVDNNTIVISSCGRISREVYAVNDRPLNFYVLGSMGSTIPIAMGIGICKPERDIIVIVGDGEVLMDLGSLVLLNKLQKTDKLPNLELYILDNNQYQSTGGQRTCSDFVKFRLLCDCKVIPVSCEDSGASRIPLSPVEIKTRFMDAVNH